jgi:hypothetical protein
MTTVCSAARFETPGDWQAVRPLVVTTYRQYCWFVFSVPRKSPNVCLPHEQHIRQWHRQLVHVEGRQHTTS